MKRGFTLIEMLVSLVITLIMMAATVKLFQVISDSVANSRSLIETADRMRAAKDILQRDLDYASAPLRPSLRPEQNQGYFEYIEGEHFDGDYSGLPHTIFGDTDDVLVFTVGNAPEPFVGRFGGQVIESRSAEVCYFLVQDGPIIDATTTPPVRLFTLYRRVLLVAPNAAAPGFSTDATDTYYDTSDLSARVDLVPQRVPNTLGDLTKHEARFWHEAGGGPMGFPYRFKATPTAFTGSRLGDDVLLSNVLAFDVQVFDPGAPLYRSGDVTVEPRDASYASEIGGTPVAFGAYADLGYATTYTPSAGDPLPLFNGTPNTKCGNTARPFVFDTWSMHYENDGIDQDSSGIADAATNGVDDNTNGLVDDQAEYDTTSPYTAASKGLRVTIRVYDPAAKGVRELVVISGA